MQEAAGCGNASLVQTLIVAKVDLRCSDEHANTALHRAAIKGQPGVCKVLLDAGADPRLRNAEGATAWDLALRSGVSAVRRVFSPSCADGDVQGGATPASAAKDKEVVRALLEAAMRGDAAALTHTLVEAASQVKSSLISEHQLRLVNTPNLLQVAPLMLAARADGGHEAVRALLNAKASVTSKTRCSCSALSIAAEAGQAQSIKLLLDANATLGINLMDTRGYTALHLASENGHAEAAKVLLDAGASIAAPRKNGWTCILSAAYHGSTSVLHLLVKKSADPNHSFEDPGAHRTTLSVALKTYSRRFAPIHLAAYNGFDATLRELVRLGARVDAPMGNGWSPLTIATSQGFTGVATTLISLGAPVDFRGTVDGTTALLAAVANAHAPACVGLLLQAKASVQLQDGRGVDALMIASRSGDVQTVQQLLMQRADPKAARTGGATALMDAAAMGSDSIVKLLLGAGAQISAADENGTTALMHAAKAGQDLALPSLLQAGASVNRPDKASCTALGYTASKQVARRLLEAGATSSQTPEALCAVLGLTTHSSSSENTAEPRGGKAAAPSNRVRSSASLGDNGFASAILRAGGIDPRPPRATLRMLTLEPILPVAAPLLKLGPRSANAAQVRAITLMQRRYRALRLRRHKRAKASFYKPMGLK